VRNRGREGPSLARRELREEVAPVTKEAAVSCEGRCLNQVKVVRGAEDAGPRPGPGHPIDTLVREHAAILGLLDELESLTRALELAPGPRIHPKDAERLAWLAQHLLAADPHHRREEEVLFPELETRGLYGPPRAMVYEHRELAQFERALQTISSDARSLDLDVLRTRLREVASPLVTLLRSHIQKENEILYPMALQAIDDDETWTRLRLEGDSIGYCCFTPDLEG
jgi:DUF438 domain-containing protein